MTLPSTRDWLFGVKTFGAAILALYIAMSLGLERPYWALASAFIASQPLSGATRSKAVYRAWGTVAGAAAAVALVPPLSNAPQLLSLALALWTAVCLYFALLNRTPASYGFMLAGYTGAIIGFPSVSAPQAIFQTALTRVEEIGIGITVATIIAQVVFPRPVGLALSARIDTWLNSAGAWASDILLQRPDNADRIRRLAADTVEIDTLAGHLGFDATPRQVTDFRLLRERLAMLLPILSSMEDRMNALRHAASGVPPDILRLESDIAAWLRHPAMPADDLLHRIDVQAEEVERRADWQCLILIGLLMRLRELVQIARDCSLLRRGLTRDDAVQPHLLFAADGAATRAWHRDRGMALLSAAAAFIAVLIVCAAWIATAWPEGYVAAEMVAVACSFFAALDDPVPAILDFLLASVFAVFVDAFLLFAWLPAATTFAGLTLALAAFYLPGAALVSLPVTANRARAFTANGATLLALNATYAADFPGFANSSIAFVLGLVAAAVVTRLMRSVGASVSAGRLLRVIWQELAVAAETRGNRDRSRYAGVMLDRLGLIAPRLAENDPRSATEATEALADIRIGLNIIDLRRARHGLGDDPRQGIDAMLDALAGYYRSRKGRIRQPGDAIRLLPRIDAALRRVAILPPDPGRRDALLGLVGIRRALFPDAPEFKPEAA